LPAFFGIETDWLAVTVPAAGKDKGLIALPDVGDRVLVLLVGESLADGVVLGGLYGDSPPPDAGVQEGRTRRFTFRTPGGQRVVLDDGGEGSVRIENESGSRFELGAKKCLVHSEVDMEIRAPGKRVTISAHSIDFEQS
jgi:phage baseplate assembly protein gpV